MAGFTEASTVQAWLVDMLTGLGWVHVSGKELPRAHTDVLIESWLVEDLVTLNDDIATDRDRVDEVLPLIRSAVFAGATDGLVAANERMVTLLRGDTTVRYTSHSYETHLRLLDLGEPDDLRFGRAPAGNRYVVSDEVTFGPPGRQRRFDIVLWVNGIPLVAIETKTPVNAAVSWFNAAKDLVNVYNVEHPTFFVPNVLMVATNGFEFRFGAVGSNPEEWELWGSTGDPYELADEARVQRSVELLLTPARVLSVLRDFTLFELAVGGMKRKLLPRYPQVEAAEGILDKVVNGRPGGLIEHYQGTGKTLLQAFAGVMMLTDERLDGATVIAVVDRLDLIEQTERQFKTAGLPRLTVANSKAELRRLLAEDYRGIIMTTIHRFDREHKNQPPTPLNARSNIVVLVDEAHRTTEGSLGDDMRAALPHARFFGMTGTPITDAERNTFKLFGDPADDGWVMSRYTPERSIADGATVPIHFEPRLVDFHLDKPALEDATRELAEQEGLSDEEIDFLSGKAASVKTIMLNPDRIRAVCTDVVDHFVAKVAPLGMKAMVVAYDRELVVAYETELKRVLAERGFPYGVEVVMTVGSAKGDPPAWQKYHLTRDEEADIKRRFNDFADPLKFVVVTAKFLTGFDAPILFAQYLDRPLQKHTLFQAITRPNRNWTNPETRQRKRYGLIVDYVGLGEEIGKALLRPDPASGGPRPADVDGLAAEFEAQMQATLSQRFDGIDRTATDFVALSEARQRMTALDDKERFAKEFTALEVLWEFLDPHPTLADYKTDYAWLAKLYETVKPSKVHHDILWARLGAKTLALVHGHMVDVRVVGTGLEEVVVDPAAIEAIRGFVQAGFDFGHKADPADPELLTVGEVLDTIEARIKRRFNTTGAAVYTTLADRIEKLRAQVIQKVGDSVEWIKKALEVARLAVQADKLVDAGRPEEAERLLDPNIGALTQIVNEYKPDNTPVIVDDLVREIDSIVKQVRFTGWNHNNPDGDRLVRRNVRDVLATFGLPPTGPLFDRTYAYVAENY